MNALCPPRSTPLHHLLEFAPRLWRLGLVGPSPALAFMLQGVAAGAAVGAAVALRGRRRDHRADTWAITTAWATLGFVLAVLIELVSAPM